MNPYVSKDPNVAKDLLRTRLIADYEAELEGSLKAKRLGVLFGTGRNGEKITIDEDIAFWRNGLEALRNGDDPQKHNY